MKTHTEPQVIYKNGVPEYAILDYSEYLKLSGKKLTDEEICIPSDVVDLMFDKDISLIAAWREHLKITQKELADRLDVNQSTISQIEKKDSKPQRRTLEKIAKAFDVRVEQLVLDD
jgi:DNA-binding XRE family transcriptional regulator